MSNKHTFAILGGDRRQAVLAKCICEHEHTVKAFGLSTFFRDMGAVEICSTLENTIDGADFIILPLPTSRDGKTLNVSNAEEVEETELEKILAHAQRYGCPAIIGGLIPESIIKKAEELGIETADFYQNEKLQQLNALPSAEGAIFVAMQNSETVLEGMRVLVTGYGRIGKLLAQKLRSLGATVTVAARRDEVLCEISMSGYNAVRSTDTEMLRKAFESNEIIFNTVPGIIFTRALLCKSKNLPMYIEIASSPGGIDVTYARERGVKIHFAPSLPGKYAPISAGKYIFEAISEILEKRGIKL